MKETLDITNNYNKLLKSLENDFKSQQNIKLLNDKLQKEINHSITNYNLTKHKLNDNTNKYLLDAAGSQSKYEVGGTNAAIKELIKDNYNNQQAYQRAEFEKEHTELIKKQNQNLLANHLSGGVGLLKKLGSFFFT